MNQAAIATGLRSLGIRAGDVVFFHSSLRSFGHVDGGADAVVDAFLQVVGADGLVIVPTLTGTFADSEPKGQVFDPDETPSRVGRITEALRRRPEARRSRHPTHSIAAIGSRAAELVAGHEHGSTFARDGPYGRYVAWGARILFLGVDLRVNTTTHAVEDWLDLPYMQNEVALVKGPDGRPVRVPVTKSPMGCRDFYRRGSKQDAALFGSGIVGQGYIGPCQVLTMGARDCCRVLTTSLACDPTLLLCDRPDCPFCSRWRGPTTDWLNSHPEKPGEILDWLDSLP